MHLIQTVRDDAAQNKEVERDAPELDLSRLQRPPKWHISRLIVNDTLVYNTTTEEGEEIRQNSAAFDTDGAKVGIDNRCSACISHDIKDFEGPVTKVNRSVRGFGGERKFNVSQGTIVWKWCDNEGKVHKFKIPNSYYIPEGKVKAT